MRLSEYASTQRTYGSRKVPRSVQQSIPIDRIYEDGTWRCGNVYSQMWSMPDINFTMSGEDNNAKILNLLGKVYMGVPSDCWLKICIVSQRMDEKSFRENVLLHRNLDGLDKWRVERNRRIRQCVQDAGNVVQHKYLILSTNKQNVTDARSRLRQVKGNLLAELSNLGCTIKPMTNNERLEVLHNFFRRGEEGRFQFSFDDYGKLGNDFRNTIAPDAMRFTPQHAEIDDGFAKAMTIAQYPQQLSDNFVATLLQQVPYIVLSICISSKGFNQRDAYSVMLRKYPDVMNIEQMCDALRISTKTGYKLLHEGKIPAMKIGRSYLIPKAHLFTYLQICGQHCRAENRQC